MFEGMGIDLFSLLSLSKPFYHAQLVVEFHIEVFDFFIKPFNLFKYSSIAYIS